METIKLIVTIIQVIISVVLVVVVLMQSGKEAGLGAISGNNETYMGKSGNSLDKKLASATKWLALVWVLLTLGLGILALL